MSIHEKIGASQGSSGRLPYFVPGTYPKLEVGEITEYTGKADGHDYLKATFIVRESNVPERPPGTKVVSVYNLTKYTFLVDHVCSMLAAIADMPTEEITAERSKLFVSDEQIGKGRLVSAECVETVAKNSGRTISVVTFFPTEQDS